MALGMAFEDLHGGVGDNADTSYGGYGDAYGGPSTAKPPQPVQGWMRWLTFSVLAFVCLVIQYDNWVEENALLDVPIVGEDMPGADINGTLSGAAFDAEMTAEDKFYGDPRNYDVHRTRTARGGGGESSVEAFLELTAVDKVLDNMVTHHQDQWMERLNDILNRKLVKSLNRAVGDMFSVETLKLHFIEASEDVPALLEAVAVNVTKTCEPRAPVNGASAVAGPEQKNSTSCVTVSVAFMYHGLIRLSIDGLRHLGSGRLPIVVRFVEGFMMRFGGKKRGADEDDESEPDDDADAEYGVALNIGAKLRGPIVISLDIHTSEAEAWPTPRRVRIKHVASLSLQKKLLSVKDEWGVLKRLLSVLPSSLLLRRLERGLNRLLKGYFSHHQGWEITFFEPKKTVPQLVHSLYQ